MLSDRSAHVEMWHVSFVLHGLLSKHLLCNKDHG
jgi:hypothetical protein